MIHDNKANCLQFDGLFVKIFKILKLTFFIFQFWACYVPCSSQYKDAIRLSLEQLDVIRKYVAKYPSTFQFVTTAQGKTYFRTNTYIMKSGMVREKAKS